MASNANIKNLTCISNKQAILEERRLLELYELSSGILSDIKKTVGDTENIYEILSLVSEERIIPQNEVHSDALNDNKEAIVAYLDNLSEYDKCLICRIFCELIKSSGASISENDFIISISPDETFTYVKNSLSDEAYDVFSQEFDDPRVYYSSSFKDAVRAVADGDVGFCLLPLEERGDRLHTVDQLIFSNDLKINAVSPVFGFDGMADMKYALISKNMIIPKTDLGDDKYLEIRLPCSTEVSLGELISSAESFGNSVYRINTVTLSTEEGESNYYSLVLRDNSNGFVHLLIYLTLFTTDYISVGIYKNLE